MRGRKVTVFLWRNGDQIVVDGLLSRGHPGRLSGPPDGCYPPEPSEFSVLRAVHETLGEVELTDEEIEEAINKGEEYIDRVEFEDARQMLRDLEEVTRG